MLFDPNKAKILTNLRDKYFVGNKNKGKECESLDGTTIGSGNYFKVSNINRNERDALNAEDIESSCDEPHMGPPYVVIDSEGKTHRFDNWDEYEWFEYENDLPTLIRRYEEVDKKFNYDEEKNKHPANSDYYNEYHKARIKVLDEYLKEEDEKYRRWRELNPTRFDILCRKLKSFFKYRS